MFFEKTTGQKSGKVKKIEKSMVFNTLIINILELFLNVILKK